MTITLDLYVILGIGLVLIFCVFHIWGRFSEYQKAYDEYVDELKEKSEDLAELEKEIEIKAIKRFDQYREKEQTAWINATMENLELKSALLLEQWKTEYETTIRQDAIKRSQSVTLGKVTEHVIPFHANFPYNPKDLRFIGSPIDLIAFCGANEEKDEVEVHILEIKTGRSSLSKKQRLIRNAIEAGRVYWREMNFDEISMSKNSEIKARREQAIADLREAVKKNK